MGTRTRSLGAALLAVAALALGGTATATAAERGAADGDFFATPVPQTLSASEAEEAWTPERIAEAAPLELADGGELTLRQRDPELFPAAPAALKPQAVNASRFPNLLHGKIVGHFPGLGDYGCSGTIVTSRSGSLLMSAGHCAYDPRLDITAKEIAFVPGYSQGEIPYGVWPVRNLVVPGAWQQYGSLDLDLSMLRAGVGKSGTIQQLGSRGIGFGQPRRQRLEAYGYPAKGRESYDGETLIRCDSGYVRDPALYSGPRGRGMHCDQQQGSSGGGWVAQHSFVVSNTSHGYPQRSNAIFYGPYYGETAKEMYRLKMKGWPSIGPVRCGGEVASIVGSGSGEKIHGTSGDDVIATLGGNDSVAGKGGRDRICAGVGDDRVLGGGGKDRVDGGKGRDSCGNRSGGNKTRACEGGGKKG